MGRDDSTAYARYTHALRDEPRPCALVDVEAFDRNTDLLLGIAGKKPLRVATKSVRCPALLARITKRAASRGQPRVSFMTYCAHETRFLHEQGLDDFLLAYPVASRSSAEVLAGLARAGAKLAVVVDDEAHLELLDAAAARENTILRVIVDVDVAYRPLPFALHLGVRRSPLRGADAIAFVDRIAKRAHLELGGIMAYEAQIAGLGDEHPGERVRSALLGAMRDLSRRDVERTRRELVRAIERQGKSLAIVNGGGTGNLRWCAAESTLTEVTAGSGFLCSHLFDRYRDVTPEPAAYFALDVVRRPGPSFVTCAGGGYAASGAAGVDRLPLPALPKGLLLLAMEGAGEVQTPLVTSSTTSPLRIGDPVFFRHAKAGELAEHFVEYLLVSGDAVVGRAKTYRGLGHAFLG